MDKKTIKILNNLKNLKVGIFIDNSNLFYAQKKANWKIDYEKLKIFLSNYCTIKVFNFYTAVPKQDDIAYKPTIKYLDLIKKVANLRTKPLKYIRNGKKIIKKGDVDLEIVIDVFRTIKKLDLILIIAGDSDYLELKNWVINDNKKKISFLAFEKNMAWEIRQCLHICFEDIREEVEYKK